MTDDPSAVARAIIGANLYLTLATADAGGRPWATPVYFAAAGPGELVWVSRPDTRHSRNIAARPEVGIVVFDSRVPILHGQGVYLEAVAGIVPPDELDRCLGAFSRANRERGAPPWAADDVGPAAPFRLYRAVATGQWVLDGHDRRIPVPLTPG
jgi:hypothetical protein